MGSRRRLKVSQAGWGTVLAVLLLPLPALGKIEIQISGVDAEVRQNVLVFLSLQRYRDSNDLPSETVRRLNDRVEREVRQALRPFGYYSPKVSSTLQEQAPGRRRANKQNGGEETAAAQDWRVDIRIEPGTPVIMRAVMVKIDGPGETDPTLLQVIATAELKKDRRLIHGLYDKLKGDLQRMAVSTGYLEATFEKSELRVDLDHLSAEADLELSTGPRYRFGPTTIEQKAVDPSLARRFLRYREGDYFDAGALLRTQFALEDSQYFADVEVITGARDRDALTVPVTITAQEYRKNTYSIGVGYATDTRWRSTIGWDNRRMNTKGHSLHVRITTADTEQSITSRYLIPVGDPALERVSLDSKISREELADLDVSAVELKPGLTQVNGQWQRVVFFSTTREVTEATGFRKTDLLIIPGISYARVPRGFSGDLLSLKPGLYAELTGSHSVFGSDSNFLRLHVQGEHVFDLNPRWHLLLRGEIGTSFVANFNELPGTQRFFAGGDNSVRGFGLNELSPTEQAFDPAGKPILDANGNPTYIKAGGRHLLVGSVEVIRDLPRNFGLAVFADSGNAINKFGDRLEYSVGIGLRWRLPVVTLGIDVAQALSQSDIGPHFHLNISPKL